MSRSEFFERSGIELSGKDRIEDLIKKLPTEFASEDTFTLENVNDTFGDLTSEGKPYTEDDLWELVDRGIIYQNEETGEYSFKKEFVVDEAA